MIGVIKIIGVYCCVNRQIMNIFVLFRIKIDLDHNMN